MQPLRILYVSTAETWGGGEVYLVHLIEGMLKYYGTQYQPRLVVNSSGVAKDIFIKRLHSKGVPICQVRMKSKVDPYLFWNIGCILRQDQPDILHVNGRVALLSAGWWRLLKRSIRVVCTSHLPFFGFGRSGWRGFGGMLLYALPFHICDSVIAISTEVKSELLRLKLSTNKVTIVYNGIPLDEFQHYGVDKRAERSRLGVNDEKAYIITQVSRLIGGKGQYELIQATRILLQQNINLYVLLVGDGPSKAQLQQLAEDIGVKDRVLFLGHQSDVRPFLAISDVFVLPSYYEGFPFSVIEAMATGVPVVVTPVGELKYIIKDGENGLIVHPGSVEELAEKLHTVLINDELRYMLSEQAKRWVSINCSVEGMVDKTFHVYMELMR